MAPRNPAPATNLQLDKTLSDPKARESASGLSNSVQSVLGPSILVRGELSANEDLLLEGQIECNVSLEEHCLTIGPEGRLKGNTRARQVIVQGAVQGNIFARDKIEVHKTGHVVGDLLAAAVAIEDGAYFKGTIDILREEPEEGGKARAAAPRRLEPKTQRHDGFEVQTGKGPSLAAQNDAQGVPQAAGPGNSEPPPGGTARPR